MHLIECALENCKLVGNIGLSASSESIYQSRHSRSRGSSIRHRPHRVSSRRNKENGSGSFRRKNSFKKSNALICTIGGNNSSNSNNGTNDDKILKVSFQNSSPKGSSQIKSNAVSLVVKMISASKAHHSVLMMEQEQPQPEQSFSRM